MSVADEGGGVFLLDLVDVQWEVLWWMSTGNRSLGN